MTKDRSVVIFVRRTMCLRNKLLVITQKSNKNP
jgi:hypothetical protein